MRPEPARTRWAPAGSDAELVRQVSASAAGGDYAAHLGRIGGEASGAPSVATAAPRTSSAFEYATGKPSPAGMVGSARRSASLEFGRRQDSSNVPPAAAPAAAVTTDVDTLDFTTAVGRPTLPVRVAIKNATGRPIGIGARIESEAKPPAFIVWEGDGVLAPPIESSAPRASVAVRFLAPTPGRHTATLVVTHDLGVLRIPVTGTALDLGAHARAEANGSDPEPVHELSEQPAPRTAAQDRSQLLDAADALSSLATTFEQTVAQGTAAAGELGNRIIAAGADVHRRILNWAVEEAVDQVHKASEKAAGSGAAEFLRSLIAKGVFKGADKVIGAVTEEDPGALLAVKAVEWGYEIEGKMASSGEEMERAESFDQHMEGVAFFGGQTLDDATAALARGFGAVMSRYNTARAMLENAASPDRRTHMAGFALLEIRESLADLRQGRPNKRVIEKTLREARDTVNAFEQAQLEWAEALRAIAAAGSKAEEVANAGFGALLDRYIQFKAGGGAGNLETRGGQVRASGFIDFRSPANIQLEGFTFGAFVDPGATVYDHIRKMTLSQLTGWDVHIELRGIYEGSLVLHQGADGPAQREATPSPDFAGQLEMLGGVRRVWEVLDRANLGTPCIWVPQ